MNKLHKHLRQKRQKNKIQKTVSSAKMPQTNAQGQATKSCCLSIDKAATNNLDADVLHHSTAITVRIIPNRPLKNNKNRISFFTHIHASMNKQLRYVSIMCLLNCMPKRNFQPCVTESRFLDLINLLNFIFMWHLPPFNISTA